MSTFDPGSRLPDLHAPVTLGLELVDGASAEVASRTLDFETTDGVQRVLVARPVLTGIPDAGTFPHEDEEVLLMWPQPSGQLQMPCLAEVAHRPYGPVWVLTPTGPAVLDQRREYFRIPLTLPAVLTPVVDEVAATDDAVDVTMVEVSEGGAVIISDDELPEVATLHVLSCTMEDSKIDARCEVLRHKPQPNGRPSAVLRFLSPVEHGDDIRRYVFALQRAQARNRLN